MKSLCLSLVICSWVLSSFGLLQGKVLPGEFQSYYRDHKHEFLKKETKAEFEYQLLYRPFELAYIDYVQQEKPSHKQERKYIHENEYNLDFILKIAIPELGKKDFLTYEKGSKTYEERILYYSFQFKNHIALILDEKDTIYPQHYHFERGYGIVPAGEFVFSFDVKNKKFNEVKLFIMDQGFDKHELLFTYLKSDLYNLPNLKKTKKWS